MNVNNEDVRVQRVSALMKVLRDPDWYDEQFPALSQRKRELHETEKGVEDVSKEMQLIIEEVAEKRIEKRDIESIRNLKETMGLTGCLHRSTHLEQ